ncbi:MAG TPA: hypothetical protein VK915_08765 [Gaiellaceae bacterium]|nr:hypothetical protein [Gaiellaceae bacterium]
MRGPLTWLVVVGLVAVAVAATVDALRGEGEGEGAVPTGAEATLPVLAREPELAVARLREAGVTGVLTFADEDCRLHAVSLPEFEPRRAPPFESCRPHVPSGGIGAFEGDVVWAGLGYGAVQIVLSKELLTRSLGMIARLPGGYRARQAVGLDGGRIAVVAEAPAAPGERRLLVYDDGRPLAGVASLLPADAALRPSPSGRYVAVLSEAAGTVRILTSGGREVPLPPLAAPRAVAWSPDERWTAVATRFGVHLFRTATPQGLVIPLPIAARDLDWGE